MNDADRESSVTSKDGVTVRKRVNQDHEQHLAVIFDVESERSNPVELEIVDEIDPDYPVGFHPDYGGQYWRIEDQTVKFRKQIAPEEQYRTVYGVGYASRTDVQSLRSEPAISIENGQQISDSSTEQSTIGGPSKSQQRDIVDQDETEQSTQASAAEGERALDELFDFSVDQQPGKSGPSAESEDAWSESSSIAVTSDGVTVTRSIERTPSGTFAIGYELISEFLHSAVIRLEQPLPTHVTAADIGFPEAPGSVHWHLTEAGSVFQRLFAPGESVTTLMVLDTTSGDGGLELEEPSVTVEPVFNRSGSFTKSTGTDQGGANWDLTSILDKPVKRSTTADSEQSFSQGADEKSSMDDEPRKLDSKLPLGESGGDQEGASSEIIEDLLGSSRPASAIDSIEGLWDDAADEPTSETDGGNPVDVPDKGNAPEELLDQTSDDSENEVGYDLSGTMDRDAVRPDSEVADNQSGRASSVSEDNDYSVMPGHNQASNTEQTMTRGHFGREFVKRLQAIEARLDELEKTISRRQKQSPANREKIEQAFNRSISNAISPELDELRTVLEDLETSVRETATDSTSVLEELSSLKEQIASVEILLKQQEHPSEQVTELAESISETDKELRDAVAENTAAINDLQEFMENRLDTLGDEVREANSFPEIDERRLGRLKDRFDEQLSDHAAELTEIKSSLASMMESVYQLRSSDDTIWFELEQLAESTDSNQEELSELSAAVETVEDRLTDVADTATSRASSIESFETELKDLSTHLTELADAVEAADERISGLENSLHEQENSMSLLASLYLSRLDIVDEANVAELSESERKVISRIEKLPISIISGIGPVRSRSLDSHLDIASIDDLAAVSHTEIMDAIEVTEETATRFVNTARTIAQL